MPASRRLRSWPEGPTKGRPCRSSWKPGASPTNISSACGLPSPKTTWVRPLCRLQRVHVAALAARSEEHTSELQSRENLVCRLLLAEKKKPVTRDDEDTPGSARCRPYVDQDL